MKTPLGGGGGAQAAIKANEATDVRANVAMNDTGSSREEWKKIKHHESRTHSTGQR